MVLVWCGQPSFLLKVTNGYLYCCSSGTSQEGQDDHLGLGDLPSDEEVISSSDEDDVSSESSKGEPDPLEDKQVYFDN